MPFHKKKKIINYLIYYFYLFLFFILLTINLKGFTQFLRTVFNRRTVFSDVCGCDGCSKLHTKL